MKALNVLELDEICRILNKWQGAQLQKIGGDEQTLVLGVYRKKLIWIWIEVKPPVPIVLLMESLPSKLPKKFKPIHNFVKSHGIGANLKCVYRNVDVGRSIKLVFEGEHDLELEVFLWVQGRNIVAHCCGKKVSHNPLSDLGLNPANIKSLSQNSKIKARGGRHIPSTSTTKQRRDWSFGIGSNDQELEVRTMEEIEKQWSERRKSKRKIQKINRESEIKKKSKSLEKIKEQILKMKNSLTHEAAESLSQSQKLDPKSKYKDYYNYEKDLGWNIENCFSKAKKEKIKIKGMEERLLTLQSEIKTLKSQTDEFYQKIIAQRKTVDRPSKSNLKRQTRRKALGQGMWVEIGKSAKDNLNVLRGSKPWDLWMHLADFPSAHAVVHRSKNQNIEESSLVEVGRWVAEQTSSVKRSLKPGDRLALLYAECRHVRPIKGDRIGRVTYQNEKRLVIKY